MKYNDINIKEWKNCDIDTDSLWLISKRTKIGKHKNIYHSNFMPQIPNQLINWIILGQNLNYLPGY